MLAPVKSRASLRLYSTLVGSFFKLILASAFWTTGEVVEDEDVGVLDEDGVVDDKLDEALLLQETTKPSAIKAEQVRIITFFLFIFFPPFNLNMNEESISFPLLSFVK